jgi:hypothetical protein
MKRCRRRRPYSRTSKRIIGRGLCFRFNTVSLRRVNAVFWGFSFCSGLGADGPGIYYRYKLRKRRAV